MSSTIPTCSNSTRRRGWDRIETGTRANVGLQYTFQGNGGATARYSCRTEFPPLGGDNIFANPGMNFPIRTRQRRQQAIYDPRSGLETNRSDYVLGAYFSPSSMFRFLGQARFDESTLSLRRTDIFSEFNYGPLLAQSIYTFSSADPTQTIIKDQQEIYGTLGLRLTDRWSLLGSMRFDIDASKVIQDSIAAEVRRRLLRADHDLHRDIHHRS